MRDMDVTDEQIESLGRRAADKGDVTLAAICAIAINGCVPWPLADREQLAAMTQAEARAWCACVIAEARTAFAPEPPTSTSRGGT